MKKKKTKIYILILLNILYLHKLKSNIHYSLRINIYNKKMNKYPNVLQYGSRKHADDRSACKFF